MEAVQARADAAPVGALNEHRLLLLFAVVELSWLGGIVYALSLIM